MTIYYSVERNAFYPEHFQNDYRNSPEGWPADAIAVGEGVYQHLIDGVASGKIIIPDVNGYPVLADRPAPSDEQLIAQAEEEKIRLLALATSKMGPLQDAVDLGIATEKETALLHDWKKYRVLLNRIQPEDAPAITWPEVPEDVA
ncbi:tail fiber assembly protein [Citrobacter braakii]|nr:tail fiber assembly protein [Citrobacter braakii]